MEDTIETAGRKQSLGNSNLFWGLISLFGVVLQVLYALIPDSLKLGKFTLAHANFWIPAISFLLFLWLAIWLSLKFKIARVVICAEVEVYSLVSPQLAKMVELETLRLELDGTDLPECIDDYSNLQDKLQQDLVKSTGRICKMLLRAYEDGFSENGISDVKGSRDIRVTFVMPGSRTDRAARAAPSECVLRFVSSSHPPSLKNHSDTFFRKGEGYAGLCWEFGDPFLGGPRFATGEIDDRWKRIEFWRDHKVEVALCLPVFENGISGKLLGILTITFSRSDIMPNDPSNVANVAGSLLLARYAMAAEIRRTVRKHQNSGQSLTRSILVGKSQ